MSKYIEYYKCDHCGTAWAHEWDNDDPNNDYTQCPKCDEFDWEELTYQQFCEVTGCNEITGSEWPQ